VARSWYETLRAWAEFRSEGDECHELDAERVLVLTHFWALGKISELEVGQARIQGASLFQFRESQGFSARPLLGPRPGALADLGLTPETAT
jgi:hypothetical protein